MAESVHFTPPEPLFAPDKISGIGLLKRMRQNSFTAFPSRCFREPVVKLNLIGRQLAFVNLPQTIQQVLSTRPNLYRRVPAVKRVLGPILGRSVALAEG